MSRNLTRVWPLLVLVFAGEVWALGLGDIRLSSALNEPLRAEIELISATPEELENLEVVLASSDTFARYGLDRPLFLQRIEFSIVKTGRIDGNIITLGSRVPVTEPFITFLVQATWSRGRLLREYTLLLDPPTFAPPPVADSRTAVTAPRQSAQTDSGRIERPSSSQPAPTPSRPAQPAPSRPAQPAPSRPEQPAPSRAAEAPSAPFDTTEGGDYRIQRGDTLWGITQRFKSDSRLTMNQTMLAIFEANHDAFGGNINIMTAGANLRIPSADEVFRINRGDAFDEVRRQNQAWGGVMPDSGTQPSLVLVPPDDDQTGYDGGVSDAVSDAGDVTTAERIRQLEQLIVDQESLFEINDDELAALRAELAGLRGEEIPEPVALDDDADATFVDDDASLADDDTTIDTTLEPMADDDDAIIADGDSEDIGVEDADIADDAAPDTTTTTEAPRVVSAQEEPGIVERIIEVLSGFWGILIGGLLVVMGVLVWFARRAARGDDEDSTGVWDALDADDLDGESLASTERLRALAREDDSAIVVVEQETAPTRDRAEEPSIGETIEAPAPLQEPVMPPQEPVIEPDTLEATGEHVAIEDTFSSETAINLDQSDPVAEADFHMAYGLYDQAADLINGALSAEPEREDLLSKLCEIYFVWGNRDAFIDAASRLRGTLADESNPEWDKIVIMGQQIASDDQMFAGAGAGRGATRSVDLSFEGALDEESELDMDLAGGPDGLVSDVIDLGESGDDEGLDLLLDTGEVAALPDTESTIESAPEVTAQMPATEQTDATAEMPTAETYLADDGTEEMPTAETPIADAGATGETPTIEEQFRTLEETGELPSIADDEATELASLDDDVMPADATAEIDLDDLGLDLDDLAVTGLGGDLDDTTEREALEIDDDLVATGANEAFDDAAAETGPNPELDADAISSTGIRQGLDIEDALAATNEMGIGATDETGRNPALEDTDVGVGIDTSLLDATGQTQILSDDLAVDTASDIDDFVSDQDETLQAPGFEDEDMVDSLPEDADTLLAPFDDESGESTFMTDTDEDFDFAKTEALPKDVFTGTDPLDDTGELPGIAGTDMDLDLDDLTAALRVSEVGDTVDQVRDDATVEQPRPGASDALDLDVGGDLDYADETPTERLAPEDVSGDLHDARTMTEVGTKLDLARAYVDMGDPSGARSILEEVLDEGDDGQKQQAQQLLDSLPG